MEGPPPVTVLDQEDQAEVVEGALGKEDNIKIITVMKKYTPYVLMVFLYTLDSHAQSMDDILRYTRPELKGTARYVSMSGAFNALGGDLSAIKDNPAAAAVFINTELGLTINNIDNKINANYFGNNNTIDSRSFNVEQFGVVLVLNNNEENDFVKLTFAYNFQFENNFNTKYHSIGVNANKSLDNYFLAYADGVPFEDIKTYDNETISSSYQFLGDNRGFSSQQAFLGFQSSIIDPNDWNDANTLYQSNSNPQTDSVNHDFFVKQTGKISKHSFTIGTQYRQNIYLGFNLNSHQSQLRRVDNLVENNYSAGSSFNFSEFENDLLSNGQGYSFQLGAIYKPSDKLRLGLSYRSPVWYRMTDELLQIVITSKSNGTDTIDPQIVNLYEYNFSTPSRLSGGLAYVFGSKGLISLQYDQVNYQNTSFDIENGDINFINQNEKIKNNLKSAGILRLGGEYRIDRFSIRGGYFNQKSIHKSSNDLSKGLSAGFGYDFGGSNLSIALSKIEYQRSESMYQEGLTDTLQINNDQFQFMVSYFLKL